ncbi:pPIWI_RE_Z domain-containing protein [Nocardiopsis alba]|uniref:pPIWI_RE_Z domain-containing protein n=1 Tax=Nocardiopsis alba TaxID=53437 RepID=UPI0003455C40|nr:hypothetical protein [Nocardiopsis alba]
MRDRTQWRQNLSSQLRSKWPEQAPLSRAEALDVELGLYLITTTVPGYAAADTWTLLGGYPYSDVFAPLLTDANRMRIRRARYYLTEHTRPHEWIRALEDYQRLPVELRGFEVEETGGPPQRKEVSWAPKRFTEFERVLTTPVPFSRRKLPVAGAGSYRFSTGETRHAVTFDENLLQQINSGEEIPVHDLDALPPGKGEPIRVTLAQLRDAAHRMDELEALDSSTKPGQWVARLKRVELLLRDETEGRFREQGEQDIFTIEGLCHLVGMVGAGKSTLRDILTFWAVTERGLRVTIVVPDVAETLHTVDRFTRLGVATAPVLGATTRGKHLHRQHRRIASAGAGSLLDHDDPSFAHLSSACPVDALRGLDATSPLEIGQAPCQGLFPVGTSQAAVDMDPLTLTEAVDEDEDEKTPKPHTCPLWKACPRHHSSRALVTASVWVTTAAGLVHSGVPVQTGSERLRYAELTCRRSDLMIVDEADQVQLRLDDAFAPSATLIGSPTNSWLDEVDHRRVSELAGQNGRLHLTKRDVDDWTSASETASKATNRCYSLLVRNPELREWIAQDYFSALTLHELLIGSWFPDVARTQAETPPDSSRAAAMEHVEKILNRFRDAPLEEHESTGDDDTITPWVNRLVYLALELLTSERSTTARPRLKQLLTELLGEDGEVTAEIDTYTVLFEFTLMLAVLHHRLNTMTTLWPRVEAALNLQGTSNVLSRRPSRDYDPVIPESPMGNVLGFQFKQDERVQEGGSRSGELRFFRCGGVGRELLTALPHLPEVDDRPGPNVLLMSGTSWAGQSTRYHLHVPVHAVLRPHRDEVAAIEQTEFEKLILTWPGTAEPLRLSGNPSQQQRDKTLEQMLNRLAVGDPELPEIPSLLEQELENLPKGRKRVLLLVGSYDQATKAWEHLNRKPEWRGRVVRLVSDDADLDDTTMTLRRGDVADFPRQDGQILIAPLLSVERGHNIVQPDGRAAIGTVYFLVRPHPRPDDISLAVQTIHDWAVRQIRGLDPEFRQRAKAAGTPDLAGRHFRARARREWTRLLTRRMSWTSLNSTEKVAFTWDQLVVIWQVIGRLVRGGVPARAVFVDSAFYPQEARNLIDTPKTGLLVAMREVLRPYIADDPSTEPIDRSLVEALYGPLYRALEDLD